MKTAREMPSAGIALNPVYFLAGLCRIRAHTTPAVVQMHKSKASLPSFRLAAMFSLALQLVACGRLQSGGENEGQEVLFKLEQAIICGVERWPVKVGTDDDVGSVELAPLETTVDTLINFPRPGSLPPYNRLPEELQVYRLTDVTLTVYRRETDSDYHLVIADGDQTMIAEIPHPDCVGAESPFLPGIEAARASFDSRYTATARFRTANATTTLIGAGFFDFIHGQRGVAPNGFELHAVLGICFDVGCDVSVPNRALE